MPDWWCAAGLTKAERPCVSLTTPQACEKAYFVHLHHLAGVGADLWICKWQGGACESDKLGCPISDQHPLHSVGVASPAPPLVVGSIEAVASVELPLEWAFGELLLGVVAVLFCLRCVCTSAGPKRQGARLQAAQEDADEDEEGEGEEEADEDDDYEHNDYDDDDYESDRRAKKGLNGRGHRHARPGRQKPTLRDHDEED